MIRSPLFRAFCSGLLLVAVLTGMGCNPEHATSSSADTTAVDTGSISLGGASVLLPGSSAVLESDVPYITTPTGIVDTMLSLTNVTPADTVYDLGSGDGRIPIKAARKYGAHAVGIEIRPDLVKEARANAEKAGVSHLVEFRQGDLFEADISDATVVTLYLVPSLNLKVRPKLFTDLKPGTRVVSHDFDMNEWKPDSTVKSGNDMVYRWTIPETTPSFVEATE